MTRIDLLKAFQVFTQEQTKDIIMPTKMQREGEQTRCRCAEIYLMRLPDSKTATKKTPYIIHQLITGKDAQMSGANEVSTAVIRSIFSVYHDNEEEGSLMLLNLMERIRIALLKQVVIASQFQLDLNIGIETFIYPEDIAPFYAGEMSTTWILPSIRREVDLN